MVLDSETPLTALDLRKSGLACAKHFREFDLRQTSPVT
jgi:hypothetical protein